MQDYNSMGKGGKAGDDFRVKGSAGGAKKPAYKEGPNPNVSVPKLPQVKGVTEQG
jgi:hypothetical protein